MCSSDLTKQGYNPPLQNITPRQPVSRSLGLAVQKLEREREVDVGEAPTQRVMVCRASTTLMTLVHTWYATPYLLVPPRRSRATMRRNPGLAGARSNESSTADIGARRGYQCETFFLVVFYYTLPSHKTRVQPSPTEDSPTTVGFSEFRASGPETRERERERTRCR